MIAMLSGNSQSTPPNRTKRIQSRSGLWGSLLIVAMVPLTIVYQMLFSSGVDTFVHWILAAGALLIALATRDFEKIPGWIRAVGALAALGLALIFMLQGLSHLVVSDWLTSLAYGTLAEWPEPWLLRLFLFGWGGALLWWHSSGKTRIFGIATLLSVLAMELYRFAAPTFGWVYPEVLRAIYLLPFVWLILESIKPPKTSTQ
jgi:hypothetical protein